MNEFIYEVQSTDTDSWFPVRIQEVDVEGNVHIGYPDKWKEAEWVTPNLVRRNPYELETADNIQVGDRVEVQTNSSEEEPFSWWGAIVQKVRGNHAVVRYEAWDEDFDDIFEKSMIRPVNENETLETLSFEERVVLTVPYRMNVILDDFRVLNEPEQSVVIFLSENASEVVLVGSQATLQKAVMFAKVILQHQLKFQELYSVMQESVVSLIELVSSPDAQNNPTIQLLQDAIGTHKPATQDVKGTAADTTFTPAAAKSDKVTDDFPEPAEVPAEDEQQVHAVVQSEEGKKDLDATLQQISEKSSPIIQRDQRCVRDGSTYKCTIGTPLPGEAVFTDEFFIEKQYIGFAIGKGGKNFRQASRMKGVLQTELNDMTGRVYIMAKSERALKKARKLLTRSPPPRKDGSAQSEAGSDTSASPAGSPTSAGSQAEGGSPKPKLIISGHMSNSMKPSPMSSMVPIEVTSLGDASTATTPATATPTTATPTPATTEAAQAVPATKTETATDTATEATSWKTATVTSSSPDKSAMRRKPSIEIPKRIDSSSPPRPLSKEIQPLINSKSSSMKLSAPKEPKGIHRLEPKGGGKPPLAGGKPSPANVGQSSAARPPRSARRSPLPSPVFRKTPRSGNGTPSTPSFMRGAPSPGSLPSPMSPSFAYPAFTNDDEKWEFLVYTFKQRYKTQSWADINDNDEERARKREANRPPANRGWEK